MSGPLRVAIAIVESAGHVLVGTRMAEFPGGKCLPDETPRACVVRECREETGLMIVPRSHLITTTQHYRHGQIELDFWKCGLSPDLPDLAPPAPPFFWVSWIDLKELDFPAGNQPALELLAAASEPTL